MKAINQIGLTDKNLDRFTEFLSSELERPNRGEQIPEGAHIFHGSSFDTALTQANLKLAGKILLGMTLGYVEEAPLVMVYEYQPGKQILIDLSIDELKGKVQEFIETFQEQSQDNVTVKLNELLAA